jgi:hypothetical protein
MKYWWVNQGQTFKQEFEGGYMWAPERSGDGTELFHHSNIQLCKKGDVVFSNYRGIAAIGIVREDPCKHIKPDSFGEAWRDDGWICKVSWKKLPSPIKLVEHMDRFRDLLPMKYSPLQESGKANLGYLYVISPAFGLELLNLLQIDEAYFDSSFEIYSRIKEEEIENSNLSVTEKERLIKARVGQGEYRKRLERVENHCRFTGVKQKDFLIASHIKPWSVSDNQERLDGNNGLLLSPHVDKLFDNFKITIKESRIYFRDDDVSRVLNDWKIDPDLNLGKFNRGQREYLEYHVENFERKN